VSFSCISGHQGPVVLYDVLWTIQCPSRPFFTLCGTSGSCIPSRPSPELGQTCRWGGCDGPLFSQIFHHCFMLWNADAEHTLRWSTVWDNLQSSCGSHRGPRSKQAVFKLFTDEANINLVHSSAAFCHQVNNSVPVNTKQMSLKTDWHSDRTQVSLTLTEHLNGEDGVGENWRALRPWSSCCLGDGGSYTGRFMPMHCQCLC
jgi:hypothetical protein